MPRQFDESEYPDQKLTGQIIGAFYYVYHTHGFGFLEAIYRRALAVELRYRDIAVAEEVPFEITHRGVPVGTYRTDLIAGGRVILEAKTGTVMDPASAAQLQNYLHASKLQVGLVLHFGPTPSVKRLVSTRYHLRDLSSPEIREEEKQRLSAENPHQEDSVV